MHFWEQFILMSITYVRGSVIKDLSEWKDPFCVPGEQASIIPTLIHPEYCFFLN